MQASITEQTPLPSWRDWYSPRQIYLESNATCNLKCLQCDIHLLKNPPGEISHARRIELIREIAAWDPRIRLAFSGGEPFLRRRELYELAGLCAASGLQLGINTNGTLFKKEDFAKIPHSGITALTFSMDSWRAEVHDRIRGVAGTFERLLKAIRGSVEAIREAGQGPAVFLTSILGGHNLGDCEGLFSLCEKVGAKALMFQPLQPNFEAEVQPDWWQDHPLWPQSPEQVNEGIDQLLSLKSAGAPTFQKRKDFEAMRRYFLERGKVKPGGCLSMQNNLMVDALGEAHFCFSQERLGLKSLGNIGERSIREIWESSRGLRRQYQACHLECGSMLCHSR